MFIKLYIMFINLINNVYLATLTNVNNMNIILAIYIKRNITITLNKIIIIFNIIYHTITFTFS